MNALNALGFALVAVFLCFLLKELGFRGVRLISSLGILCVLLMAVRGIGDVFDALSGGVAMAGVSEVAQTALRILGVGYVYGICSDICRDCGENGIASAAQVLGRVEIFLLSVPYILRIFEYAGEMISG